MKTEFKEGDLVYNPRTGTSIYRVEVNTDYYSDVYPLAIAHDPARGRIDTFTQDGKLFSSSELPALFKATKENHELLSKLYGVEFEALPTKPTPREIIKALIMRSLLWQRFVAPQCDKGSPQANLKKVSRAAGGEVKD